MFKEKEERGDLSAFVRSKSNYVSETSNYYKVKGFSSKPVMVVSMCKTSVWSLSGRLTGAWDLGLSIRVRLCVIARKRLVFSLHSLELTQLLYKIAVFNVIITAC